MSNKGFTLIRTIRKNPIIANHGFTLIELLIVIFIIGILIGLSVFGLQGARASSRDAKRKADLEQIRSAIEIYKADCGSYPSGNQLPSPLIGDGSTASCLLSNIYLSAVPEDPIFPNRAYWYSSDGVTYEICAALEQSGQTAAGLCTNTCGGVVCNHKVNNP